MPSQGDTLRFPSGAGWPAVLSQPGSIGDSEYSPYITYFDRDRKRYVVLNASQVRHGFLPYNPAHH